MSFFQCADSRREVRILPQIRNQEENQRRFHPSVIVTAQMCLLLHLDKAVHAQYHQSLVCTKEVNEAQLDLIARKQQSYDCSEGTLQKSCIPSRPCMGPVALVQSCFANSNPLGMAPEKYLASTLYGSSSSGQIMLGADTM